MRFPTLTTLGVSFFGRTTSCSEEILVAEQLTLNSRGPWPQELPLRRMALMGRGIATAPRRGKKAGPVRRTPHRLTDSLNHVRESSSALPAVPNRSPRPTGTAPPARDTLGSARRPIPRGVLVAVGISTGMTSAMPATSIIGTSRMENGEPSVGPWVENLSPPRPYPTAAGRGARSSSLAASSSATSRLHDCHAVSRIFRALPM